MTLRHWALLAATLWLLLQLPRLAVRYSYDWDASQYARGAVHFDLEQHQPHPPGYPLYTLAVRALRPLAAPPRAQILISLLLTLGALYAFHRWTQSAPATLLLAFSPTVAFYAGTQSTYPVDLLSAALLGWLSWRILQGEHHLAVPLAGAAAVLAGFRQSGVTFLLPLVVYCVCQTPWRRRFQSAAVAAAVGLAWLAPLITTTGSLAHYRQLTSAIFEQNLATTSLLYGAPLRAQFFNFTDAAVYLAVALCGFCLTPLPAAPRLQFALLAAGPALLFAFFFHCPKAGYLALALPPIAWAIAPRITLRTAALGLVLSITISWFPFELIPRGPAPGVLDAIARFLPRYTGSIEDSNAELARFLDTLPPETPITILTRTPEAPNYRTVTYDFPTRNWQTGPGISRLWLTGARQPQPAPTARPRLTTPLITVWEAP